MSSAAAWRIRGLAALAASSSVAAAQLALPDPAARADALYALVVAVGYGHLIGAAIFARRRAGPRARLRRAFAGVAAALGFVAYASWLPALPLLVLPLLAVSMWHAVENDVELPAFVARSSGAPPLPRSNERQALALGATALVLAFFAGAAWPAAFGVDPGGGAARHAPALLRSFAGGAGLVIAACGQRRRSGAGLALIAALLPDPPAALGFADLFALASLYHLASALALALRRVALRWRGGARAAARRRVLGLVAVHAVPAGLCAALFGASPESTWRGLLFSPALYLFGSVLHVVQTAAARGFSASGPTVSGLSVPGGAQAP